MINESEKKIIIDLAKQYHVKRVLLFGSNANKTTRGHDIDLAVEGIEAGKFFDFCGELSFNLSIPADVIDLNISNRFTKMVRREGIPLYG